MRLNRLLSIGLVAALCGAHVAPAAVPLASASEPSEVLDEVVVTGSRLWKLRAEIVEAEDRWIARYNALNPIEDFDIHCLIDAPTGTRLLRRYCLTVLQERGEREDSIALVNWSNDREYFPNAPPPRREVHMRLLERAQDYEKNLILLLQEHPELRKLTKEHDAARKRYQAALRAKRASAK